MSPVKKYPESAFTFAQARVGVVTPCYNAERFLASTIQSVDNQTLDDWIHVLVNDGSTDSTAEILDRAADNDPRRYVFHQQNHGQAFANNWGAATLKNFVDYLFFLDADDTVHPEALERGVAYLDAHPEVGAVFWLFEIINESGELVPNHYKNDWDRRHVASKFGTAVLPDHVPDTPLQSVITHCGMVPSCTLFRRSVFEVTEGFNESNTFRKGLNDLDLYIQVALNAPVHRIPHTLTQYRTHSGQITADISQMDRQYEKLLKRWRTLARHASSGSRVQIQQALLFAECRKPLGDRLHAAAAEWKQGSFTTAIRVWLAAVVRYMWSLLPARLAAPAYLKVREKIDLIASNYFDKKESAHY